MTSELTIRPLHATATPTADAAAVSRAPHVKKKADPAQKFEAFVLQTFIQEMLPKESEAVYGSGVSGDFWKSMMAEKVAEQVAERGGLGIANYVREGHPVPHRSSSFNPLDLMTATQGAGSAASLLATPPEPGE